MYTGEMAAYARDSMREVHCQCGNLIRYNDIDLNCDFPKYGTLKCKKCGQVHRIIIDGAIDKLTGATLE